jgi:DNA-binding response OmpR family regulator
MNDTTHKICIIDDDPFLLDMYSLKFQQAGFEVACFSDSTEAVESLRKGDKYSAVLLDLVMPKLDGFGLLKTIREENLINDNTALVILSNQGQDKEIARAEEFGIDGYLIKANTLPSEVLEYVKNLLDTKSGAK